MWMLASEEDDIGEDLRKSFLMRSAVDWHKRWMSLYVCLKLWSPSRRSAGGRREEYPGLTVRHPFLLDGLCVNMVVG